MRKKQGFGVSIFVLIFVFFTNVMEINAVNTGFEIKKLPGEQKDIFITNSNIRLIEKEPTKKIITCFDVNSNQLIAVGQDLSDQKRICIYSKEGVFQYGYTFNCTGSFGVEWDQENLNIYFVRSSVIVSVSPNGEILGVFETENSIENNSYENHFIRATKRTIDGEEYIIKNDLGILNFFATSYSRVVVKELSGAEQVIYDVGAMQLSNMIVVMSVVCIVVSFSIVVIVRQFKKER